LLHVVKFPVHPLSKVSASKKWRDRSQFSGCPYITGLIDDCHFYTSVSSQVQMAAPSPDDVQFLKGR